MRDRDKKLTWDETFKQMALSDEQWVDFDVVLADGLEEHDYV